MRKVLDSREYDKFVPSRLRPGQPESSAVEVIIGNVNDIAGGSGGSVSQDYFTAHQDISSVVSGITTSILTHTFSSVRPTNIYSISASGENISLYELFIDSVLVEKKRTYFGSGMNVEFNFNFGFKVGLGSTIQLKVVHMRSATSDYNATLKYAEVL